MEAIGMTHTQGKLEFFILDEPLDEIPAYVERCIQASGGKDFYFVSGKHSDGGVIDVCHVGNGPSGEANARRLVACWNACDGIDTDLLEEKADLAAAGVTAFMELKQTNEMLLEALKEAADSIESWGEYVSDYFKHKHGIYDDVSKARAAIARAEGGQQT